MLLQYVHTHVHLSFSKTMQLYPEQSFFRAKFIVLNQKAFSSLSFLSPLNEENQSFFSPTNFSQHLTVISRTPNTGFEQSNATLFAVWGWRIGFSAKGTRQTNWKIRFGLIFSIFPDAETLPDGQGTICWEVLGV